MKIYFFMIFLVWTMTGCTQDTFIQGKKLYEAHCANCHMNDGTGLGKLIPPLAKANYLKDNRQKLACIIKYGISETITVNGKEYKGVSMAGISELSEIQINNIINYIFSSWGNEIKHQSIKDTKNSLNNCKP